MQMELQTVSTDSDLGAVWHMSALFVEIIHPKAFWIA